MRRLSTFAIALLASACLHAAPASVESVETLLHLSRAEASMEASYAGVEQLMRTSMSGITQGKPLSAEQQRVLDAAPAKFTAVMREEMSWAKLKPHFVKLYAETFDQAEIDGLIAFYRSPAGQAFIDKMPVVVQKSMAMTQTLMQSLMPKMQAAMQQAMQEARIAK